MQGTLPGGSTVGSRRSRRRFCSVIAALVFFSFWNGSAAWGSQVVHRHLPESALKLRSMGRLPSTERLNFIIGLPLRNQEVLTNLLEQLYDPANSRFHRYLTPAQFAQEFGPSQQAYQSVIAFAKANGLIVTRTHANRTLV